MNNCSQITNNVKCLPLIQILTSSLTKDPYTVVCYSTLPFSSYLNIPKNKFRLGFNLAPEYGFRANVAFQHDDAFIVDAGQFSGTAQEKNLIDAGFGYRFNNGISVDLTATNLFDNEYRALPNMPLIGRRVLGKLTFDFGGDKE